jgi:type II secretion system protein G
MGRNSTRRRPRCRAFTMIDILVVLLIVCLLTGMLFSAGGLSRTREISNRVSCAANLKQIGLAIQLYENENKGSYPRTLYAPGEPITQYTGVECKDPFGKDGAPKPNDITAAMFLLVRTQDITSGVFICPATDCKARKFVGAQSAQDFGNFKSQEELSYSMGNMYPDKNAVAKGYKMNAITGADMPIVADMNPGTFGECDVTPKNGPKDETVEFASMRKANSMNHRGEGQNVLYGDGHVEFQNTAFCGVKRDNIYTVSGANDGSKTTSETIAGSPMWAGDAVLLPAATANSRKMTPLQEEQAAIADLRKMVPEINERLATQEKKGGETPQIKQMKELLVAMGKELDEAEARSKAAAAADPKSTPDETAMPATLAVQFFEGRIKWAKSLIWGIKVGLEAFEVDNARFPTTAEGLAALVNPPPGLKNWHGPYVDAQLIRVDPWGNPYVYPYPGLQNPKSFELISLGPDGHESADDITD